MTQLRPINLCNVTFKLITKTIVNRLKTILPSIISPTQFSFVPGKSIIDNIVVVQELLHTMRCKPRSKGTKAIKIDLDKAYNFLSWGFIAFTLQSIKLPPSLVHLIMDCITIAEMSFLWNGSKTEPFKPSQGIRQGDLLSPYIFFMCIERLSQIVEALLINGEWKPIIASRNGPQISHIFFCRQSGVFCGSFSCINTHNQSMLRSVLQSL